MARRARCVVSGALLLQHCPQAIFYHNFDDFPTTPGIKTFQFCDGWELNRNFAVLNTSKPGLINAYPNSDAVARKNYLSKVVEYWTAKRPGSILCTNSPLTIRLSLDYAEYVDESLAAADDLTLMSSLEMNEDMPASQREWWILKPALVDCGAGIRLFSTMDELASHLELAEDEIESDEETEDEVEGALSLSTDGKDTNNNHPVSLSLPGLDSLDALVTTIDQIGVKSLDGPKKRQPYVFSAGGRIPSSEMREFVAQRYVTDILPLEKRKWHVRAYVLCIGRLKVHVFRDMLALLAAVDYEPPWNNPSLMASLTNTALQDEEDFVGKNSMRKFSDLPDDLLSCDKVGSTWKDAVFEQICAVSSEVFRAAAYTMADKFTTLDSCFELFGVDFLIDANGTAWLLEVNETPAFYQQGAAGPMALELMESVVCVAMEHMNSADLRDTTFAEARKRMVEVLDETSTLAKSNITEITSEV
ncbi:TTL domain-containing protein [Plectosphaerella plurivora]|uniref:TTL domain-containing protein n=1 Tax=Plectosphaerella plurivora TaxID=936078 RepID=A0A9P8VLR4_9PEZI|nr:TTL domain-containing protein [Plectosphaerella plurivora]